MSGSAFLLMVLGVCLGRFDCGLRVAVLVVCGVCFPGYFGLMWGWYNIGSAGWVF